MKWDEGRYELGAFRVARAQVLRDGAYPQGCRMADPYWGVSLSRRWQLFQRSPVKGFFGFGLALKTESNQLSATRWDFASQLGLRFRIPGQLAVAELTVRHWSNAGIRLPNHGQDFVTLTVRLNTSRFGVDRREQISVNPNFESSKTLFREELRSGRRVFGTTAELVYATRARRRACWAHAVDYGATVMARTFNEN